ncbi:unnamed protein product [Didymodactylos carnosus]|uniref:Uncharacterized protein n=1 Tax=Didymodactylos carnosus TaxID=1234261 RepID=A0A816A7B6_9BILA|nr:unnamed protein product [Didymodactylos carnosus]CAF4464834.1 unnamed protein product [Didymodactylos carnosus]
MRLAKCKCSKKCKLYFQSVMLKPVSSIVFTKFTRKIKVLFYFELCHPALLKASLKALLTQIIKEYNNRRMYENALGILHKLIERFFTSVPSCFTKTYHNAQILGNFRSSVDIYVRSLLLVNTAYFANAHVDSQNAKSEYAAIESTSDDIGRVIYGFIYSSHAILCNARQRQKPRLPHRASRTYRYRFCECFKESAPVYYQPNGRWSKQSNI